jgi:3-oxoacyl-[acyl-carrier protein] reductase
MLKRIIVVGASRGIGYESVKILGQNADYEILALSRDLDKMKTLYKGLNNVHCFSFDLRSNVHEQLCEILNDYSHIDVLINNAGWLVNKPFSSLTHDDLINSYQINTIGVMETVQAVLPKMIDHGGHIVNVSSMGGVQGTVKFAGLSAYSTSKAALCSFTELFAEEYKDSKIKMNCLALGAAQTEMLEEAFPGYIAPLSATQMANYIVDFALTGDQWFSGKIIPVSLSTP